MRSMLDRGRAARPALAMSWRRRRMAPLLVALWMLTCAAQLAVSDFSDFWQRFRSAALAGNVEQIADLTRFPFETRGPLDGDPVRRKGPSP